MTTNGIPDWHDRTFRYFPCLLCATETRRSCFCKLELVSFRKELGELSISICALLPCSCNSYLCLWTMATDESYVLAVSIV